MEQLLQEYGVNPEIELYNVLKHATKEQRDILCREKEYKALCNFLIFEDHKRRKNPDILPQTWGSTTFKMMLESFPDFSDALNFIQAVKPGFIYTQEFQNYVRGLLKIKEHVTSTDDTEIRTIEYTLGKIAYDVSYFNGIKDHERWYTYQPIQTENGIYGYVPHREGKPADIQYPNEVTRDFLTETWYFGGQLHREDGPAITKWFSNSKINTMAWYVNNKLHRIGGPARIIYFDTENDKIFLEEWYIDGMRSRTDGPAFIEYYKNGQIKVESWFLENVSHREGGPSRTVFYKNGKVKEERWRINDELHRLDGPAETKYRNNGSIISKKYYVNGVRQ